MKEAIDLQGLLDGLDFSGEDLLIQAPLQAKLFIQAARYRVIKMQLRSSAQGRLESLRASLSLQIRATARERGEKVTEEYIRQRLLRNPKVREAGDTLAKAEAEEEFSKLLVEAYRHRKEAARIVADMLRNEDYAARGLAHGSEPMVSLRKIRQRLESKYPGAAES